MCDFRLIKREALLKIGIKSSIDQGNIAATQAICQDVDDTDSGTTQRERIFGTGRRLANSKHTSDGIKLIGNGHNTAGHTAGKIVACKTRTIVIADSLSDLIGFTGSLRVITAHDTLLVSELNNSRGNEVGFGEMSSALSIGCNMCSDTRLTANCQRKRFDTLRLL